MKSNTFVHAWVEDKRDHTKSKATAIYWTLSATPLKFKLQFQTVEFRASCTPNNCSRKDAFTSNEQYLRGDKREKQIL